MVLGNLIAQLDEILLEPDPGDINDLREVKRRIPVMKEQIRKAIRANLAQESDLAGIDNIEAMIDTILKEYG